MPVQRRSATLSTRLTRRQATRRLLGSGLAALLGGAAASLLAACQAPASRPAATSAPGATGGAAATTANKPGTAGGTPTAAANPLVKPRASGADLTALVASSELALGRNRFALGLIDARNQPVTDGSVRVEFFKVRPDGTAEKRAEAPAAFRSVGGASKGIWVSQVEFGEVGPWGAQVTLERPNEPQSVRQARVNFEVRQKFSAPGYGDPAPRSVTPTERDAGGDVSHICSNNPPCVLHRMTIADALASGQKPLVVVFATPALCTSQICAPELDAVLQLHQTYADQANFIHVEIYQYPFDGQQEVKAVDEWRLPSEPWTFVVDRGGIVRDRFEGAAPPEELEPALKAVLT